MPNESYEEWLTDFAASRLTAEDLERLLARSRDTHDDDLRRLVKSHVLLRRLVREGVLPMLGTPDRNQTVQPAFVESLRRLVGDD
jgi:hypothetical protein